MTYRSPVRGYISTGPSTPAEPNLAGELIAQTRVSSSGTSVANVTANVAQITLTAGSWNLTGYVGISGSMVSVTQLHYGISSTSATITNDAGAVKIGGGSTFSLSTKSAGSAVTTNTRVNVAAGSTVVYYICAKATGGAGTALASGWINARRVA